MKNWTVRQRILASFLAILAIVLVMAVVTFQHLSHIEQDARAMERSHLPALQISYQMQNAWLQNYGLTQDYIAQTDPSARGRIILQLDPAELRNLLTTYRGLATSDAERSSLDVVGSQTDAYFKAQAQILKATVANDVTTAHALVRDKLDPPFQKILSAIQVLPDLEKPASDDAMKSVVTSVTESEAVLLVSAGLAIVLALICGYLLLRAIMVPLGKVMAVLDITRTGDFSQRLHLARRDEFGALARTFDRMSDELTGLISRVQKSGDLVNSSTTEIAATAHQQQATANEIAATTIEISATSKEISATSKELVRTMAEVASAAEQSAALASSGQTSLAQMEETMQRVTAATSAITEKLAVLTDKAATITHVVTTITKVADQTNLLSLNAAIEAEKAGEYGRGFSVVATEIRRLADQTATATYDIEQIVKEIQSSISSGVMGMDKFSEEVRRGTQEMVQVGAQFSQIIEQVQTMSPRFESVSEGMQVQSTGAEQITQALSQLSEATHQTAESLRQSNISIERLKEVASALREGTSRFKLEQAG